MPVKEQAILQFSVVGANQGINEVRKFQTTTTKAMTGTEQSISRSLGSMVAQYASFAAAITATNKVLSSGVEFNKFVENQTMSFTVMMKSADKAKGMMKDLYDFAVNSPLTFKETAGASKQLMAYGFAAEELIPTMKSLGTVAIATGHSLDDISYIYGTLRSQGRAYSRDLMQFGMRGIPIYEELAKVMGVGTDQIQKMASQGKIGFKEVEKAFQNMTTNGGRFAGILEGYMDTLTGKLSMLSDISQRSAGTATGGIFDSMKDAVETLTKTLSGKEFQKSLEKISRDLGGMADIVFGILNTVVKLLPLISTLVKLFLAFAIGASIYAGIMAIQRAMAAIGELALAAAVGVQALGASATAAAGGFATLTAGVSLLSGAMKALIIANPWLTALIALATVGGTILTIMHINADNARNSEDPLVRGQQLGRDYKPSSAQGGMGASGMYMTKSYTVMAKGVAEIAKSYKLADNVVADILIKQGALSKAEWDAYDAAKKRDALRVQSDAGVAENLRLVHGLADAYKTIEDIQAEFLSNLTGMDVSRYYDPKDINALGKRGADDYIKSFSDAMQAKKTLYGKAFTPDIQKSALQAEMDALYKALDMSAGITDLVEKTNFDETIIERIRQIAIEIENFGKNAEKTVSWVTPLVKALKELSYISMGDDGILQSLEVANKGGKLNLLKEEQRLRASGIEKTYNDELARVKEVHAEAQAEFERMAVLRNKINEDSASTATLEERQRVIQQYDDAKAIAIQTFQDEVQLADELAKIRVQLGIKSAEEIAQAEKEIAMDNFERMKTGNPEYWDSLKASAGTGNLGAAAATSLQGTEVGSMMAGADPITMAVMALADFAKSIENVSKVLNPFQTIIEAMRPILEPLINGIFEPMVNMLEMFGEVLGQLLAPAMGFLKILTDLGYVVSIFLMIPLQMLGSAFVWFYNSIIYPVGSWIIDAINGVIKQLNKIPGVHIRYLKQIEKISTALKDFASAASDGKNSLTSTIDYLKSKLNSLVDDQVRSMQELYEVGAISGAEMAAKVAAANAGRLGDDMRVTDADKALVDMGDILSRLYELTQAQLYLEENSALTDQQVAEYMESLKLLTDSDAQLFSDSVYRALVKYNAATTASSGTVQPPVVDLAAQYKTRLDAFAASAVKSNKVSQMMDASRAKTYYGSSDYASLDALLRQYGFASGTPELPRDMIAQVHKGEGIIPATFMDGIRRGELSLSSGGNEGGGQTTNVYVTVQGSVQTENNLADSIANRINIRRSRGMLTV